MARPKRSEHIRERLQLFLSQGYHGTGIKKVIDQVNIPKGSFYHYAKKILEPR